MTELYHPVLGTTIEVADSAVPIYMKSGWTTQILPQAPEEPELVSDENIDFNA